MPDSRGKFGIGQPPPAPLQWLIGGLALLAAVAIAVLIWSNPAQLGQMRPAVRALPALLAVALVLSAVFVLVPGLKRRPGLYLGLVCAPVLALCLLYYLACLPGRAGGGVRGEQLASQLITDNTSNGIIEVGFSYPIYTPTLSLTNDGLYTRQVDVYLRMTDGNEQDVLFRAVRQNIEGNALSVEASVHGLLSRNTGYLFIPVTLPPGRTTVGRVVFVIANLDDGSTFSEALGRAYPAQFELRDPENGELLASFPLTHY